MRTPEQLYAAIERCTEEATAHQQILDILRTTYHGRPDWSRIVVLTGPHITAKHWALRRREKLYQALADLAVDEAQRAVRAQREAASQADLWTIPAWPRSEGSDG